MAKTALGFITLVLLLALGGCAGPRRELRATVYDIDLTLDPAGHTLIGDVTVQLGPIESLDPGRKRIGVDLQLHPDITVDSVQVRGADLESHRRHDGDDRDAGQGEVVPRIHRLILGSPGERIAVTVTYHGTLQQDVDAGEKEGEIHNLAVSAHIGEEGLYLEPSGYWYPRVVLPEEGHPPSIALADFRLSANPVDGFEFVAGLERESDRGDGRIHWSSPFALDGAVLLGGPLKRWSRQHGDITLHAVLPAEKAAVAEDVLDASAQYLDNYQPLIGPYPFREFTLLEAFFSSGFAFPTCTQIAGSQLSEYKQYRRHGYLDHELLHNWWGNGVFVDPDDGNWCEGLASYLGNYYGFILDGDEAGARKQRRNQSNFLSAIEPEDDKPLGTFGQEDGAGRGIGYNKGAAVFHMLSRRIGQQTLFGGLRQLAAAQMGQYTSWTEIQAALEHESGIDLEPFFAQWLRRGGAPLLELTAAQWKPGSDSVSVTISQGDTDFALDVPLRLHYGERSEDVVVVVVGRVDTVEVPCESAGLTAVELDPDYHVFRRLKPEEVMPTSAVISRAEKLLIVVPDGELAEGYQVVVDTFRDDVAGDGDEPRQGHEVVVRQVGEFETGDVDGRSVLIVGNAVHQGRVKQFLSRTRSPVRWMDSGFTVEGEEYSGPGHAVLVTVHHPDRAEDGVMVYYGNSVGALANARVLRYYANSLLVYETPVEGSAENDENAEDSVPEAMPHTEVIRRMDFEFHDRVTP